MLDRNIKEISKVFYCFLDNENLRKSDINMYCESLRASLNGIFPSFKCLNVLYTENTDKEFFGCRIYPAFVNVDKVYDILTSTESIDNYCCLLKTYQLELDGKLFRSVNEITPTELALVICNEVNNYTSSKLVKDFVVAVNNILVKTDDVLDLNSLLKSIGFLSFTMKETMRYMSSIFCCMQYNDLSGASYSFTLTDRDVDIDLYNSACHNIKKCIPEMNWENPSGYHSAYILLEWYLQVYKTVDKDRSTLILLKKAVDFSGSVLFKQTLEKIILDLESKFWNFEFISMEAAKPGFFAKIKLDGLKSIEDDLYEFKMRIRNVETQDDALLLMRQINNRMAILDEYLIEHDELTEKERKRWENLFEKYSKLREELSDKSVYNRKMYGLFVDYNALQQLSNNNMTMNTYY